MSEFVMLDLAAPTCVSMPQSLTVRDADAIHALLLQAVREQQAITIDCSAATEIDLTFVQLVLSARKSAVAAGRTVLVVPPANGQLADVLRRGGLVGAAAAADQGFWNSKETTGGEDRSHSR